MYELTNVTRRSGAIGLMYAAVISAALGFAGDAQARDNLTVSIGFAAPGVQLGAAHAYPVYQQPYPVYVQPHQVYVQPQPIYVQPRYFYVQPAPIYRSPQQVYYQSQPPVYVDQHPGYRGQRRGHHNHGYSGHEPRHGYAPNNYAPVYYQR